MVLEYFPFEYFVLECSYHWKLQTTRQADVFPLFNSWNLCFANNHFTFRNDHVSHFQLWFNSRLNIWILFKQARLLKIPAVGENWKDFETATLWLSCIRILAVRTRDHTKTWLISEKSHFAFEYSIAVSNDNEKFTVKWFNFAYATFNRINFFDLGFCGQSATSIEIMI